MIQIAGSKQRDFFFPGAPAAALDFYRDLSRLGEFLPHISLVEAFNPQQVRMCYHTRELGAYLVSIYADLQARTYQDDQDDAPILAVEPAIAQSPVASERGLNKTIAHGRFQSESRFYPHGEQTRIDYTIKLYAQLPPPLGLRFVPDGILNRIAQNIAENRMEEIITGFIDRSLTAFHNENSV